jgi:AcrR family transcriptional regulator
MSITSTRRYGGLTPDERRDERRRRLLDAALELFGTRGFAATTIEQLCAEARVAPRHFYEAVPSREQLLRELYDEVVTAGMERVIAAIEPVDDDPATRLTAGLEAFVHAMLDDPRRARVQAVEIVGVSGAMEHHRRRVIHAYADLVAGEAERYVAEGRLPDRDHRLTALALVGGVNELLTEWVLADPGDRPDLDHVVAELVAMYLHGASG